MINNLTRSGRNNIGGLKSIKAIPTSEVSAISEVMAGKVTITLASGKAWRTIDTSFGTKGLEDTPAPIGRQQPRDVTVSGRVPGADYSLMQELEAYAREGFIVLVKDNNDRQRLVGNLDEPMFFSWSHATGTGPEDANGIEFSFKRTLRETPPFID